MAFFWRITRRTFLVSRKPFHFDAWNFRAHLSDGPLFEYEKLVSSSKINKDEHQRKIVERLQQLHETLKSYHPVVDPGLGKASSKWIPRTILSKFRHEVESLSRNTFSVLDVYSKPVTIPKGIYLYGDVGTGKTFLMDLFYENSFVKLKKRVHFHKFMLDVHFHIHRFRQQPNKSREDPIPILSRELISKAWLLCFDEFQVTDVADAAILHRLFRSLFEHGAVVVATGNRAPEDLYKNGLQRELFLPFIDLLKQRNEVCSLNSGLDYRLSGQQTSSVYFSPLGSDASIQMDILFQKLTHGEPVRQEILNVSGRQLIVPASSCGIARFTFNDLCIQPLGAADYIAICQKFHTLFVSDIPLLNFARKNEARRFITFVDEAYNHKVKLVCSAAAIPEKLFAEEDSSRLAHPSDEERKLMDDLSLGLEQNLSMFTGEEEQFMFARAVSRLREMQSDHYRKSPHFPEASLR